MVDLDKLYRLALEKAAAARGFRKRFAFDFLKRQVGSSVSKPPALLVSGLRGVGKTTLLLQLFDEHSKNAAYFSADSLLVKHESIYAVIEQAYRSGSETVFVDEIHSYARWVEELKNVFDDFNVRVVASGSSTAAIRKGSLLLGRRAVDCKVEPLSLGEFFFLKEGRSYSAALEDALDKRRALEWLAEHRDAEKFFREYLSHGGFPSSLPQGQSPENCRNLVYRTMRRMIYEDAVAAFNLSENKVDVCEKLLAFLASSTPGEFSYSSFASFSGYSKSTVYEAVALLSELGLVSVLWEKASKAQAKHAVKLSFCHPNLRAAFAEQLFKEAGVGALREEFLTFHLRLLGVPTFIPRKGRKTPDYEVELDGKKLLLEVGGPSKNRKQLQNRESAGTVLADENLVVLGFAERPSTNGSRQAATTLT